MAKNADTGSPALAGIDRNERVCNHPRHRFPRTRGDRPQEDGEAQAAMSVPPHSRG